MMLLLLTVHKLALICLAVATPSIGANQMGKRAVAEIGIASVSHMVAITIIIYAHLDSYRKHVLQFEPAHEIMALFVLRTHSIAHAQPSSGARCLILVGSFVYFHTSCVRTAMALAGLRGCAGSPEPSLVAYVISTKISCTGSFYLKDVWQKTTCMISTKAG